MISTFPSKTTHQLDNPIESERKRHKTFMHHQPSKQQERHPHFEEPAVTKQDRQMQDHRSHNTDTASHNPTHGTFTPITQTHSREFILNQESKFDIQMITEESFIEKPNKKEQHHKEEDEEMFECPCGHMHGPGQGNHHDVHAVGLAPVPLLRGPD
ncbi:hypothetical protein Cantr_07773 [Candida viswanathii]|uniref:Uncharacterized protein n=1 Tax=Candida viswanathii TaxID=5486 RepID=A0A367Y105_9ASCO|nr:hypothetical protein Cantr_07773 [Candida viswanathii]